MEKRGWMISTIVLATMIGSTVTYAVYVATQLSTDVRNESSAEIGTATVEADTRLRTGSVQVPTRRSQGIGEGSIVVATADRVRLRAKPSLDSNVLDHLYDGEKFVVTGDSELESGIKWYPVESVDDPRVIGYVAGHLLKLSR